MEIGLKNKSLGYNNPTTFVTFVNKVQNS